jgi:hypothetical protein
MGQVAIYCRVSTDDQSCERQERDLLAYANRAGHTIVGVFKETASGARNDRVERAKVMALAQARKIDAILVTELSRWGRSTQDLVQTLDDLHSWKVSVLAQTGLSFDLSTSTGKLMRTIMAGLAEFERYAECTVMRSPRREDTARRGFFVCITQHNGLAFGPAEHGQKLVGRAEAARLQHRRSHCRKRFEFLRRIGDARMLSARITS